MCTRNYDLTESLRLEFVTFQTSFSSFEGMSLELQHTHQKQLEAWIGTGPKDFRLLYRITQDDGYDAHIFHKNCDNQGPTVTVLYYSNNTIFGGYTSVNWNQTGGHVKDDKAFLFLLLLKGKKQYHKYPVKSPDHSIFCHSESGPSFGLNGNESLLYKYSSGYFRSIPIGYMNIVHSYDCDGLMASQIHDNRTTVIALVVYKVTDKHQNLVSPWRKSLPWKQESLKHLMEWIECYEPPEALNLPETRILMMGPIGAGKSSFFNTIDSIFMDRISQRAYAGSTEHSLTNAYKQYKITSHVTKKSMRFRLCDGRGIEETDRLHLIEFNYLLEGNIPVGYKFDGASPISTENPGFIHNPSIQDKVHCVLFVFDSNTVDMISTSVMDRIKDMHQRLIQTEVPSDLDKS